MLPTPLSTKNDPFLVNYSFSGGWAEYQQQELRITVNVQCHRSIADYQITDCWISPRQQASPISQPKGTKDGEIILLHIPPWYLYKDRDISASTQVSTGSKIKSPIFKRIVYKSHPKLSNHRVAICQLITLLASPEKPLFPKCSGKLRPQGLSPWLSSQYHHHTIFTYLKEYPSAVTFFGGTRIKADGPYLRLAHEIGQRLVHRGVPPRTGGGSGMMESVPQGFVNGKDKLHQEHPTQ